MKAPSSVLLSVAGADQHLNQNNAHNGSEGLQGRRVRSSEDPATIIGQNLSNTFRIPFKVCKNKEKVQLEFCKNSFIAEWRSGELVSLISLRSLVRVQAPLYCPKYKGSKSLHA